MKKQTAQTEPTINYREMSENDFDQVINLGTEVHGSGYLDHSNIKQWFEKGILKGINTNFVAYHDEKLVGFRITFAMEQWDIDQWSSPELWQLPANKVCYFKCNSVDEDYRGLGIGSKLLKLAIDAAKKQGAIAGVSHLWIQSPGNSAVKYFTKCGGKLIKEHPDRWHELSVQGYDCVICPKLCHCSAAEMIIDFSQT